MSIIISGYQIQETLNKGERTIVYRGVREVDKQLVILKVLKEAYPSPRRIAWFKRESELLKRLKNVDGVVNVHDFLTYQNRLVITLEDFGAQSLADLIKLRPLRMSEFIPMAIALVDILGQVHQQQIIHKDINPSNVIYNAKTGQVKLIDFGISTDLSREKANIRQTKDLKGTLAYISPEQTGRMNRIVDYRTDFYSLGATFYEMLIERVPFTANDTMELIHAHIAKQPEPPHQFKPAIPPILSDIVLKLMAKNAEDRYQSAFGIKADLEECWQRWQATGRIDPFLLAQSDVTSRFQLPQKLYGRETEIKTLLAAFDRISQGRSEMMLVAGYSGVGKTVLVQEVHKPMTRQRGYFIAGKFDQLLRDIPYASLTQAFKSLIRQLLSESDAQIAAWKEKLLAALGPNGQVIIDVILELEWIIGPQPAVPELGPMESQNRFNLYFQYFIQVFTKPEHPLVVFLDDLQWADEASLKLLHLLMTTVNSQHLFVIGAYRDNEVSETHPLLLTLAEIKEANGIVNTLTLAPLTLPTVTQLIADAVNASLEEAQALSKLVYAKTQGNPFFLGEFLKSLYDEELLTFDTGRGRWRWDLANIEERDITDNVIELMAGKVQKLEAATQQVLKFAACIGNQFDLQTLAIVSQKTSQEAATNLWPALVDGLVQPLDEEYKVVSLDVEGLAEEVTAHYKFAHDRVQQAVYSLIPHEHKQCVHLEVGQLLLKNTPEAEREQKIFDIVKHFNLGQALIKTQEDQEKLARLSFMAGCKAKSSAAYKQACHHLRTCVDLLGEQCWEKQCELSLQYHEEGAEAAYLSGDFEQMERLVDVVLKKAPCALDKVRAYQICVQAEIAKNYPLEGLKAARAGLEQFGVEFPEKPSLEDAERALAETKALWEERGIADLFNLPQMTDPEQLAVAQILQKMYFVSYVVDPQLYQVVVSKLVSLSIQYGNNPLSSTEGYVQYGMILCGIGDIDNGYNSGLLAWQLVQHFDVKTSAATVNCMFNGAIKIWVDPLKETLKPLLEAYKTGENNGNFMFATLSLSYYANHLYLLGLELSGVEREIAKYNEVLRNLKQEMFIDILDIYQQSALNLMGKAATETPHLFIGDVYDEACRLPIHLKTNNAYSVAHLYLNKLVLCYLFDENTLAVEHANKCGQEYLGNLQGLCSVLIFNFHDSLARLAVYQEASEEAQQQILEQVTANQVKMQIWAEHAPANYRHKFELVEAELSRVSGKVGETRERYDNAIMLAVENGFLQDEALANELAARFYLGRNQKRVASHYLRDAVYAYIRWGAIAKVQQLEKKYADLLAQTTVTSMIQGTNLTTTFTTMATRTGEHGFGALDFMSVLKASQTLSGEIVLDKLLSGLMRIVIENAGAEKGYLIINKRGQWVIEASGEIGKEEVKVLQSIPIQTSEVSKTSEVSVRLPLSIINYVTNIQESVVLNDAVHEGEFTQDSYIVHHQPKSVLCFPLLNQRKLQGILYLENNLSTGAFTPDRIQVLSLLSTQVAISIENARLYGHQVELTDSYSRFVPMEYLKFLQKERIMDVQLGDHVSKEMAVMFSDIRSFTTLSEKMTAQENFNFVNSYLKRVSSQIRDNNGFIVKYLGDGMMAVFPSGADDALRAGIGKLRKVEAYNIKRQADGRQPIKVGVGIHVGHMMVGMVGEVARMQGDAFSDNVNLTSRLESLTKFYGVSLVISEETLNNLENPSRYHIRFLDKVIVKGRTESISIYEVLDGETKAVMELKLETQANFEKGMRHYQAQRWTDATFHFNEVLEVHPEDQAAALYMERVNRFIKEGVPDDWAGVTTLTEK